jgi:hypothetical protein
VRYAVAVCGVLARVTTSDLARPATWTTLLTTLAVSSLGGVLLAATTAFQSRPLYMEATTWAWLHLLLMPSMLAISIPMACAAMSALGAERMRNAGGVVLVTVAVAGVSGWGTPLANRVFRYEMLRAAQAVEPGTFATFRERTVSETSAASLVTLAFSDDVRATRAVPTLCLRVSLTLVAPLAIGIGLTARRLRYGRRHVAVALIVSVLAVVVVFVAGVTIQHTSFLSRNVNPTRASLEAFSFALVAALELLVMAWWAGRARRVEGRA